MNVKFTTLSDWQRGRSEPRADSILLLCKYFNVSADYLLGLSEAKRIDPDAAKAEAKLEKLEEDYQRLDEAFRAVTENITKETIMMQCLKNKVCEAYKEAINDDTP